MIGYVCKYTPVELLTALGAEPVRLQPLAVNFCQADMLMHSNICSFTKAVLEEMANGQYNGLVLTTCCDSVRRLYDVLRARYPALFLWMLDVPRKITPLSCDLYAKQINSLERAYKRFSDEKTAQKVLGKKATAMMPACTTVHQQDLTGQRLRIGVVGARCGNVLTTILKKNQAEIVVDMTCTGMERHFSSSFTDFSSYAEELLRQIPCVRMVETTSRIQHLNMFAENLDGIIYHTMKFCDTYSYEYASMLFDSKIPILKIETDATLQCAGQIQTRVEAFLEGIRVSSHKPLFSNIAVQKENIMYILGVDSGSTSTNAVLMDSKRNIVAFDVIRTGAKSRESAQQIIKNILDKSQLQREDISIIVSTGYGRVSIPFADMSMTEISCHGKGAHYFNPSIRTVIDIGGQDSKAIRLNEKGEVVEFVMNDKCAAGTGRFLEMMARTLDLDIAELGSESLRAKGTVEISSMCSVFAESEVISLIAQNIEKSDIAHGIHAAIAGKAFSLLKRVGLEEQFMMSGGVAKNPGVVRALEERLGAELYIAPEPEIVGAVGAALFGWEIVHT